MIFSDFRYRLQGCGKFSLKGLLLPTLSCCIFFLSVVDCQLSGVTVDVSCLLLVIRCRVVECHCRWLLLVPGFRASGLSDVGC
jgi:hypothetical protein